MTRSAELEALVQFLDGYLAIDAFDDYPGAMNGLQVERRAPVEKIIAAVDASEITIRETASRGGHLLVVHHGLFWGKPLPLTGRSYRKVEALIRNDIGVYSAHLPLDAHPEVGNCALLAHALDIEIQGPFGAYQGREVGWWGTLDVEREDLRSIAVELLRGEVRLIPGGPDRVNRVGVVTGGGGSFIGAAAEMGLDTLVTGEGAHHTFFDAMELGINVLYAGHYATETLGVREITARLAERFGLSWEFVDVPTGL